jgi:hypothetical protein
VYRFLDFVGQNVMLRLRKRKIQGKLNGPKLTEKLLGKNLQLIPPLNLKNEEILLLSIIENYGQRLSKP